LIVELITRTFKLLTIRSKSIVMSLFIRGKIFLSRQEVYACDFEKEGNKEELMQKGGTKGRARKERRTRDHGERACAISCVKPHGSLTKPMRPCWD